FFLYDSSGTLLAVNDDFFIFSPPTFTDPGSGSPGASLLEFTFDAPGTYVIGVAHHGSQDEFRQIRGHPLSSADAYTLHIALENRALNPGGSDPVAEVEPNAPPLPPPPDLSLFAQNVDDADWVVNSDPDLIDAGTIPHVYVRGTGDGTFDY